MDTPKARLDNLQTAYISCLSKQKQVHLYAGYPNKKRPQPNDQLKARMMPLLDYCGEVAERHELVFDVQEVSVFEMFLDEAIAEDPRKKDCGPVLDAFDLLLETYYRLFVDERQRLTTVINGGA